MNKIVFECIKTDGSTFTLSMESADRAEMLAIVPATVAAYRREEIEVISASTIEEMAIDLDLHATKIEQPVAAPSWRSIFTPMYGIRPLWIAEKIAAFGGIVLAIIGFDNGFAVGNVLAHVEQFVPALVRVL